MLKIILNLFLTRLNRGPWPYVGKQKTRAKKALARLAAVLFRSVGPPAGGATSCPELKPGDWWILARLAQVPGNKLALLELQDLHGAPPGREYFQANRHRLAGQGLIYVKAAFKPARWRLELTDAGRVALLLEPPPPVA